MRGARGAVFRDARGECTAHGTHGARSVCGAVFRDTLVYSNNLVSLDKRNQA